MTPDKTSTLTEMRLRFQRILLNLFSSLARSMVGLLLGIMATPIILRCLGEEQFGSYRVLLDWSSQLGLLEFGLFPSLQAIFAKALSKSSRLDVASVSREAHKKYLIVLLLQLLGMAVIYLFSEKLIPVRPELEASVKLSVIIISINTLFSFSQVYRAYLDASQRGYVVSTLMLFQNIVFVFFSVLLAVLGYGLIGQTAAFVASIGVSFIFLLLKTWNPLFNKVSDPDQRPHIFNSFKDQRTPQFLAYLCGRASLLTDNLIISFFLGAKTVTAFYLTQRLIGITTQQLQQIGNATWPAMTELFFSENEEVFKQRLIEITQIIAFSCGVVLAPLCFLNPPFVILWTGEQTFAGTFLNSAAIYNAGLFALVSFWQWCFAGTGLVRTIIPYMLCQAVVNVSLSLLLTKFIGLEGPVLGTLIAFQVVTIPWQTYLMKRVFDVSWLELTKAWVIPFVIPVGSSILLSQFIPYPVLQSWSVFFLGSFAIYLFCGVTFLFLFLPKQTRNLILTKLQDLLKRQSS